MNEKIDISGRWSAVQEEVERACQRAKCRVSDIKIVAVSKRVEVDRIVQAYDAGVRHFGENYVQEALPKLEAIDRELGGVPVEWHFIGALQSKKARKVVGKFTLIHSVDRWSLVEALEKARKGSGNLVSVLVEVNLSGEPTKSGVDPFELKPLLEAISERTEITVGGLMTFPPLVDDPEISRPFFAELRELAEDMKNYRLPRMCMDELSMGVTSDFKVAIEEGATIVRIGTAIFGPRPKT